MMNPSEWQKAIEGCLSEMSDLNYQKKIWVEGQGPEVSSFVELICNLYDDYDFKGFLHYIRENNYSQNLVEALNNLNNMLKIFLESKDNEKSDAEIIKNLHWQRIVKIAAEALILLKKSY